MPPLEDTPSRWRGWQAHAPLAGPQGRRAQRVSGQHSGAPLSRKPDVSRRPDRQSARSPGAAARVTMIWVVTTWCGRAILCRPPAPSSPAERMTRCCAWCGTCARSRRTMAAGRRIAGWTARHIGMASNWMSARFRSCCSTWRGAMVRCSALYCRHSGRWLPGRPGSSSVMARGPVRIAGRRMPATRRSRSRCRWRHCWQRPILPRPAMSTALPTSCGTRPMHGTEPIERLGSTSTDTRARRGSMASAGYYVRIAPEVPGEARAELRGMVDVRQLRNRQRVTHVDAPTQHDQSRMRWRWCGSGCGRRTTRASSIR